MIAQLNCVTFGYILAVKFTRPSILDSFALKLFGAEVYLAYATFTCFRFKEGMCGSPQVPREQTLRPKFSILGRFLALPTETSFTTPHYYTKYEVWAIELFCGAIPLNSRFCCFFVIQSL